MAVPTPPARARVLGVLSNRILSLNSSHPLRVAIDGIDAAGKTMLAGELETALRKRGRSTIRASMDGFHRPRVERYRRGADSPEGYYQDSFDHQAVLDSLLLPLGPGGDRQYRCAAFDYRRDGPTPEEWQVAPADAVLLFDGVFLLRAELNPHWDVRIFVKIFFETSVERGCLRDLPGAEPDEIDALHQRYRQRYIPGQRIYLQSVRPESLADTILENDDIEKPTMIQQGWT